MSYKNSDGSLITSFWIWNWNYVWQCLPRKTKLWSPWIIVTGQMNFNSGTAEMTAALQSREKNYFSTMAKEKKQELGYPKNQAPGVCGKSMEPLTACVLSTMKVKFWNLTVLFWTYECTSFVLCISFAIVSHGEFLLVQGMIIWLLHQLNK